VSSAANKKQLGVDMAQISSALKKVLFLSTILAGTATPVLASPLVFTAGDLIISTVSGSTLDSASPITLKQFSLGAGGTSASAAGALVLPQTANGANAAISGEYGSASEGILQQSVNGKFLTIMGYGVNAATFNSALLATYGTKALGQTTSLSGQSVTTVPRVVALIGANGSVDTTTAITGIFNTNNPRSVATVDGSAFYVSGQASSKTDPTQGVFYALKGATTATAIDTTTDTRVVSIVNNGTGNTLYVSRDYNPPGSGLQNNTNVDRLTGPGGGLPTSSAGLTDTHITPPASPLSSGVNNGSINLTAGLANGVNNARIGSFVYLSPEQFFFADATTLYVADSGQPKNGNANKAALGEGGLQKWTLNNGTWTLDYDLVKGLSLVNNATANANTPTAPGVTGLFGLTGKVVNGQVELFATSYGLNELSPSFLYDITDTLSFTTIAQANAESFTALYSSASGELIRGVAFAPTPLPSTWLMLLSGFVGLGFMAYRGKKNPARLATA
jgi:hypothetical protein